MPSFQSGVFEIVYSMEYDSGRIIYGRAKYIVQPRIRDGMLPVLLAGWYGKDCPALWGIARPSGTGFEYPAICHGIIETYDGFLACFCSSPQHCSKRPIHSPSRIGFGQKQLAATVAVTGLAGRSLL